MRQNTKYIVRAALISMVTCALCIALMMSYKMPTNNATAPEEYELYDEYYDDYELDDDDDFDYEDDEDIQEAYEDDILE